MPNARSVFLKFYWSLFASFFTAVLMVRCGADPTASKTYEAGDAGAASSGQSLTSNQYAVKVDYNALRNRQSKSISSVEALIEADLNSIASQDRRFVRYFTLTNLYNGGTPDPELAAFRHGLSKMVNSLSYNRDIVPPVPVDPEQTVFRINLRDYGWSRFSWDEISRRDPYALLTNSQSERQIRRLTGVRFQAYARADWFAVNGMQAPLYHLLLDIPRNIRSLEFQLGVNVDNNIRRGQVIRGGFNGSGVSQQNRMVEWHQARFGGYWKSYDFEPSAGRSRRNLFEFALDRRNFGGNGFDFAGGEMIFQLPNGLSGYVLTDANGNRINQAPTAIVADPTRPDMAVSNGLSCFRCHHSGMIPYREMIRDHFEQNAFAFSRREVETVRSLYAPQSEHVAKLKAYDTRFAGAVSKLGFPYAPPGGLSGDTEPVYLLARNFESEIPVSMAAAELGMSVNDFQTQLARSRFLSRRIGNLSLNGTVKREIFEDNFGFIVEQFRLGRPFFRRGSFNLTGADNSIPQGESSASIVDIENVWESGEDRRHSRSGAE
jgi:hypothetical protein